MRIVSCFAFASALAVFAGTTALADLTDPTADTSIPLRGAEPQAPAPEAPLVDTQSFSSAPSIQPTPLHANNAALSPDTAPSGAITPMTDSGASPAKAAKQSSGSGGGLLGAPDQALKKSVGLSDRATKGSLELTDQAAKSSLEISDKAAKASVGLADRAAKTSIGVPGKILKSLF